MQVKTSTLNVAIEQTLAHKELAPGVSAFKLTRAFTAPADAPAWFNGMLKASVSTGLIRTPDLLKFMSGEVEVLRGDCRLELLSPAYLQMVQNYGYCAPQEEKALLAEVTAVNNNPIDPPEGWSVVSNDVGSHMLYDVEGNPLPIGIPYDYISGYSRDGCYDMEKLVAYLNNHPQAHPLLGSGKQSIEIEQVPYYNVSPGCTRYARFVFAPTQEQMLLIWEKAKTMNENYPSVALREAIFALDIMGLRAAGIARSDSFYGVDEPESEQESNDD